MDLLKLLEEWYAASCNGDWEHTYGVKIGTLDNPGWIVEIDLIGTPLENLALERIVDHRTEHDWLEYWVENGVFKGYGGARNLSEILYRFAEWNRSTTTAND